MEESAFSKPYPKNWPDKKNQKAFHVTFIRGPIVSSLASVNNEATPSLAFAYLAGYIAHYGYDYTIIDGIAEGLNQVWPLKNFPGFQCQGLTHQDIIDKIPKHTDIIAFSTMFSGEWPIIRELINAVKQVYHQQLIIAGGEHITALTEFSLRDCPAIDLCVRGEGEQTFYAILETIKNNHIHPATISGIGYLTDDGQYIEAEGLPRIKNINEIPWPIWPDGYLEKFWNAGKSYGIQSVRDMPIMASRGCPYKCTFCSNPTMWTTRYILRDIDNLIEEIKFYIDKYNITALQFYDLTAITKKSWTIEFCNKLIENKINLKWSLPSGTRSEALDTETLSKLKETNCNYLVYAPESGSPTTLKSIKKQLKLENLTSSVIEAKRQGITVRTNLMIGFPSETRKEIFQTIRYGLYLAWKGADEVSINIFSPYPGTELFHSLVKSKKIVINDQYFLGLTSLNSDYTIMNPMTCNENMGSKELAFYRISFMLLNYIIGYIRYPSRIIRTLKNILSTSRAETVFEHRLKDMIKRKTAKKV